MSSSKKVLHDNISTTSALLGLSASNQSMAIFPRGFGIGLHMFVSLILGSSGHGGDIFNQDDENWKFHC